MPLFTESKLSYWSARSVDPSIDKKDRFIFPVRAQNAFGKTAYIYCPRIVNNSREGCITEGVFDTIKLISYGYNSLATFNAEASKEQIRQIVAKFDTVNIWYDNDDAGNTGSVKLSKSLRPFGITTFRVVPSFGKDAGDYKEKKQALFDYSNKISLD
jgi:DNA primase